ncbi:hypothetical protein ACF0H5_008939 [Mactra antiquata]
MSKYQYYSSGSVHPYAHRLRLKPTTSYIQSFAPERSLTVTNLRITPRTAFEMERPQTGSAPHLVVINTSFRTSLPDRSPRKHVPTFPKLATDPQPNRQTNVSRLTNSSFTSTVRKTSAQSSFRRNASSATRYSARRSAQNRETSSRSDRRGVYLTQRQTNTFAAYAKYNDIVQSTKAKERATESTITTNNNDLSALVPEKKHLSRDIVLSNEKHVWISDWVASTSAAMRLDDVMQDDSKVTKTLSVIHEQT